MSDEHFGPIITTVAEARAGVEHLLTISDPEDHHIEEDRLHRAALRAIATGAAEDPAAIAATVLESMNNDIDHWYA